MNKTRPKQLSFRVNEEEYQQLQEKVFQPLAECEIVIQIGDAALREQEIGYVHAERSFPDLPADSGGTVSVLPILYNTGASIS